MKAKFREFFAKHRHLIVISLILAVILAALTPLVVPLGLELEDEIDLPKISLPARRVRLMKVDADDYSGFTVRCALRDTEAVMLFRQAKWAFTDNIQELCSLLNSAPEQYCGGEDWYQGHIFSLYQTERTKYYPPLGATYYLLEEDGRYVLRGRGRNGKMTGWYISDADAQALMAFCPCSTESYYHNPRQYISDPAHIASASLLTWTEEKWADPVELTEAQIEELCAFLQEQLVPAKFSSLPLGIHPDGENGWQVSITTKEGITWRVQYNDFRHCLSLCCTFPDGEQPQTAARYTYPLTEKTKIVALPQLLEEVP